MPILSYFFAISAASGLPLHISPRHCHDIAFSFSPFSMSHFRQIAAATPLLRAELMPSLSLFSPHAIDAADIERFAE
jgi:hypothetical protein